MFVVGLQTKHTLQILLLIPTARLTLPSIVSHYDNAKAEVCV